VATRSRLAALETDPAARILIGATLVVGAGLAWAWTAAMAAMPDCHRVALTDFTVMWTIMMAAMMLPAVTPVVLAFLTLARPRTPHAGLGAAAFVAGYLVIWGLLALPARALLSAGAWLAALPALAPWAATAGGVILVACGIYQLTPLKDACLRHCRVPHLFLGQHWRDGVGGAFVLGVHHGLFCAGCCASLMIVLLVVGVMNLAWMVGLSALIFLEKVVPAGMAVGRAAGIALCAAGVARLVL
jgi:predicted metal-binding membrane protein